MKQYTIRQDLAKTCQMLAEDGQMRVAVGLTRNAHESQRNDMELFGFRFTLAQTPAGFDLDTC